MRRNKEPQKKEPPPPAKNGAGKLESTNWFKETALHGFKYFTFATSVLAKVIWVSQNQSVYARLCLVNSTFQSQGRSSPLCLHLCDCNHH